MRNGGSIPPSQLLQLTWPCISPCCQYVRTLCTANGCCCCSMCARSSAEALFPPAAPPQPSVSHLYSTGTRSKASGHAVKGLPGKSSSLMVRLPTPASSTRKSHAGAVAAALTAAAACSEFLPSRSLLPPLPAMLPVALADDVPKCKRAALASRLSGNFCRSWLLRLQLPEPRDSIS